MNRTRIIHVVAGALVTVSVALAYLQSDWWLLLGLFVGLNLFQYGFSRWCLLEKILERMGVREP